MLYQQTHTFQPDKDKCVKRKSAHSNINHKINVQKSVLWATLAKFFKKVSIFWNLWFAASENQKIKD